MVPDDVYGLSKLFAEQAVRLWERRTGTAVGVARLFNVIGPGETNPHLVPEILAQAADGDELRLGNLDSRRDYVYVDDVAAGLQALAGHSATVNLGRGEAVDGHALVAVELGPGAGPRRSRRCTPTPGSPAPHRPARCCLQRCRRPRKRAARLGAATTGLRATRLGAAAARR